LTALPAQEVVPLCVPAIHGNEWRYVKDCLDTNWVSSVGSYVERFEQGIRSTLGRRHAVATASGTAALHTALLVAGVQPDDEVVVSSLTFIAPVNAIRYVGAWPVFLDAERECWQLDVKQLAAFLESGCVRRGDTLHNRETGRRVRALLPVHILGHPVDMDPLLELARAYRLVVVEDASESLGARYRGRPVGGMGELACLSFNGNKLLTTGGGGMLLTDDAEMAQRAKYLTTQAKDDPIEFVHGEVGYNYRLTNLQAAVGVAQLEQLDAYLESKRAIAQIYGLELSRLPGLTVMPEATWADSAWWLYTVLIDAKQFGMNARALRQRLLADRVETRPLWQPINCSPAHRGSHPVDCPVAEWLHECALSLPCSVGLTSGQQLRVIDAVTRAYASTLVGRAGQRWHIGERDESNVGR
jgi:perosamine synthetase